MDTLSDVLKTNRNNKQNYETKIYIHNPPDNGFPCRNYDAHTNTNYFGRE